ncbi:MAG: hypothetical protein ACOYK8_08150 [Alphaproteobacteria bacterium]
MESFRNFCTASPKVPISPKANTGITASTVWLNISLSIIHHLSSGKTE